MVDVSKVTAEQEYIIARHSRMIGKVLVFLAFQAGFPLA